MKDCFSNESIYEVYSQPYLFNVLLLAGVREEVPSEIKQHSLFSNTMHGTDRQIITPVTQRLFRAPS